MKLKSENEMELDLGIDLNRLEKEWADQPRLRFHYGVLLAEAEKKVSETKAEMELSKAELEMAIRSDPEKFGIVKVTEATVAATVLSQEEYTEARKNFIQAQYEKGVLDSAVSAIDHKKKGLEKEVDLWLGNYFSSPKAPEGAKDQLEEMSKKSIRKRGCDRESEEDE